MSVQVQYLKPNVLLFTSWFHDNLRSNEFALGCGPLFSQAVLLHSIFNSGRRSFHITSYSSTICMAAITLLPMSWSKLADYNPRYSWNIFRCFFPYVCESCFTWYCSLVVLVLLALLGMLNTMCIAFRCISSNGYSVSRRTHAPCIVVVSIACKLPHKRLVGDKFNLCIFLR